MRRLLLIVVMLLGFAPAFAVQPDEILPDPTLEARAREISAGLRCMVCQNQSIDDSDAPLARDLRLLVRERLVEGDSDAEVRAFLVDRYGEFVLLQPPLRAGTLLLWAMPLILLAAGATFMLLRARKPGQGEADLTDEEKQALDRILTDKNS